MEERLDKPLTTGKSIRMKLPLPIARCTKSKLRLLVQQNEA